MTTEQYIKTITSVDSRRESVVNRQCVAFMLKCEGYQTSVIGKAMNRSMSHINYMTQTFSWLLDVNDHVAVSAKKEYLAHKVTILPHFEKNEDRMVQCYAIIIDNKRIAL